MFAVGEQMFAGSAPSTGADAERRQKRSRAPNRANPAWTGPRIAIGILAGITFGLGVAAFLTPWTLAFPGWGWLWRHQEPEWPIGMGALWMACGIASAALSRRPPTAAAILLVPAIAHPLALGTGCVDPFCGYFYWHGRPTVIPALDVAAVVIAFSAGVLLGRTSKPPRTRSAVVALAVIAAVGTVLAGAATVAMAVLSGIMGEGFETITALLLLDVVLGAVAGTLLGRATLRPAPDESRFAAISASARRASDGLRVHHPEAGQTQTTGWILNRLGYVMFVGGIALLIWWMARLG
jgi:hypothetical protein